MQIPRPGDVLLDKYRLDEVLGEGGFGVVFLATTLQSGRLVAIKVLKPGSEGYDLKRAARFMRELRTIAKLQNPHTLTMYDYGKTADGLMFMVTEYVEGEDLGDLLKRKGALNEYETAHVLLQVLESLREAHDIGVLHRDIKPANIRVFEYGNDPLRVKVLDFGLAKSLGVGEVKLTEAGKVVGTPRFMSPEQLRGKKLNAQTDIYSLGLVAVELLLGRREGLIRTANRRPSLTVGDPVRRDLRLVINTMVESRRRSRYRTAAEVVAALQPLVRQLKQVAHQPGRLPREQLTDAVTNEIGAKVTADTRKDGAVEATEEDIVPPTQLLGALEATTTEEDAVAANIVVVERSSQPPRSRSISMVVDRMPVWVWVVAGLVAIALAASVVRLVLSSTEQVAPVTVPPQLMKSRLPIGTAGCGEEPPHVGHGLLAWEGNNLGIVIPRKYKPMEMLPVVLWFGGADGSAADSRADTLARAADRHDVIIAQLTPKTPPAPILASLSNTLCVDMQNVFAVGHRSGARDLMSARCALPLRAMVTVNSPYPPEPSCDEPPAHLALSAVHFGDQAPPYPWERWVVEHGCIDPTDERTQRKIITTRQCSRSEFVEVRWLDYRDFEPHKAIWDFFGRYRR